VQRKLREEDEAADRRQAVENFDFKDGKYTGSVVDGVPNGFGTYEFTTKIQASEPKPLTELQLAQEDVDRVVAAQNVLDEEYTQELRKRNLDTQPYTNAQQLFQEAKDYYDGRNIPKPGELVRTLEFWKEQTKAYNKKMKDAKPKHDEAEAVWKPFKARYEAKRTALIEEARVARSKREALDVAVTDYEKELIWESIKASARGKSVGQRVFAKWATAKDGGEYLHSKYWYSLFRADPKTVDGDNDLRKRFVNEVYVKMSTGDRKKDNPPDADFFISKEEFMQYFKDRADGKIAVDIPVPDNQTMDRFISYEGFWLKGQVVDMDTGKMEVADENGVNTELSGSFGPGFVPIQVDMVSYTKNGDKLVVDGLKMVRGEWVGSSGAKGANAVGVWKLSPPGTISFDGDSDLKSGIFLKAELSGKVTLEFDTGEKITANVKGPANSFKVEGEVQVEIDGMKYNGVVTGYGADGKPLVKKYDTNPPPPPQKTATSEERARRKARAQGANAKADARRKEADKRRAEQRSRHRQRVAEELAAREVPRKFFGFTVLGVVGYAAYESVQSQLCQSVITDYNLKRFIDESISEYSWEGGTEIDFKIHPVLQKPISQWDVHRVTDLSGAFSRYRGSTIRNPVDLDLSKWEVSRVETADGMLMGMKDFNSDLSAWKVVKLKSANDMFSGCLEFDSDISNWNVGRLRFADQMFLDCRAFDSDVSGWNVANLKSYFSMFQGTALSKRIDDVTDAWPSNVDRALLTRGRARRAKSPVR
jgi:hypothetical protein